MTPLRIHNRQARWLWLNSHGLAKPSTGPLDVMSIIRSLGFVQLDTIRYVERAHDHILWSRNQKYRPPMLNTVLGRDRAVFEHFTHDASVLPMETYPMWQRQFRRKKQRVERSKSYAKMCATVNPEEIKARIAQEGPLCTQAFDTKIEGKREMWARPPHKIALDYMWYAGELATSHRENFKKFYDLRENIIPAEYLGEDLEDAAQLDWLCKAALDRLIMATPGDLHRFWEAADLSEVKSWAERNARTLIPVDVESADGSWITALAPPDIEARLAQVSRPSPRLRILNPFDPAIRDRARLKRLFGLDYRIEIFVPEAKRKWGYYVFPVLEGDRFTGRVEARADRKTGCLDVLKFWPDADTRWGAQRAEKLQQELVRFARFAGLSQVCWSCARP